MKNNLYKLYMYINKNKQLLTIKYYKKHVELRKRKFTVVVVYDYARRDIGEELLIWIKR